MQLLIINALTFSPMPRFSLLLLLRFWFLVLLVSTYHIQEHCMAQFVESYTDYKHNHFDDELNYKYYYHIAHPQSGVFLHQAEQRNGDQVLGQYGLLEADGQTVRNVYYKVDGDRGFRSIIRMRNSVSRVHQLLQVSRNQPRASIIHAQPVAFVL